MESMNAFVSDQEISLASTAPVHSEFGQHCGEFGTHRDDDIPDPDDPDYDENNVVKLAKINGMVCDAQYASGALCGKSFGLDGGAGQLRRHLRTEHHIDVPPMSRRNINNAERNARRVAILGRVLRGEWRDAVYTMEPHTGPANGLLEKFATTLEEKATNDATFRATYGSQFHRRPQAKTPKTPGSKKRNAFAIDDAPASESPSKRGRGGTRGRRGRGGGGTSETPTRRRSSRIQTQSDDAAGEA
ncbi:hypothetical protein AK830_g9588 [Neonectria ditissima]|uniref:Uncharacterized protein n=1 Tax=Neonectria ditissima TaxID=78410 RepID=A0A0P7B8U3_9HYPO|nr:hypothetical protein AK830_g9588 [Neonectria ditissima]